MPVAASQAGGAPPQSVDVVKVVSKEVGRTFRLPGEFLPYLSVDLHAKVAGFVKSVNVDRGSMVKEGELLVTLEAPELAAQRAEGEAKVQTVESQRAEAEAKLASAQSTYDRLKTASATPGAVAANEVIAAEKEVDAGRALVRATQNSAIAARASVQALKEMEGYLKVTAPFSGVITMRYVHPGALVGTGGSVSTPLLRLEQNSRLRLVVAVPESDVGGIVTGARVAFTAPAYPGQTFQGTVARVAHALDTKTRTMAVELDVSNPQLKLAPGMYPEVQWPVKKHAALLVPPSGIVVTTERVFVIRVRNGKAEWVDVKRGQPSGDLVEVLGPLATGDEIVKRGTDELRDGASVASRR